MESKKHAPGAFCWAELNTIDGPGAKKFYAELFGWEPHDDEVPGGGIYTMLQQDGGFVGALFEQNAEMKAQGIPPHWMPYVTVESVAATAEKAKDLGGEVVMGPLDVMDVGSMLVMKDPSGAMLSAWQPKQHTGYHFTDNRPGTVCWNELMTRDVDAAGAFYTGLFGWGTESKPMGDFDYTIFKNGDAQAAGMMAMDGPQFEGVPPHWLMYWSVADCAAAMEKAKALGGKAIVPPSPIPGMGTFSVLADPQGAVFAVFQGRG